VLELPEGRKIGQAIYKITVLEEYANLNHLTGTITVASEISAQVGELSLTDSVEGTYVWVASLAPERDLEPTVPFQMIISPVRWANVDATEVAERVTVDMESHAHMDDEKQRMFGYTSTMLQDERRQQPLPALCAPAAHRGRRFSHSSATSSASTPPPSTTASLVPRVSVFSFFNRGAFFAGLPFAFLVLQFRAALSYVFFCKLS
jgi:hypothetical protein